MPTVQVTLHFNADEGWVQDPLEFPENNVSLSIGSTAYYDPPTGLIISHGDLTGDAVGVITSRWFRPVELDPGLLRVALNELRAVGFWGKLVSGGALPSPSTRAIKVYMRVSSGTQSVQIELPEGGTASTTWVNTWEPQTVGAPTGLVFDEHTYVRFIILCAVTYGGAATIPSATLAHDMLTLDFEVSPLPGGEPPPGDMVMPLLYGDEGGDGIVPREDLDETPPVDCAPVANAEILGPEPWYGNAVAWTYDGVYYLSTGRRTLAYDVRSAAWSDPGYGTVDIATSLSGIRAEDGVLIVPGKQAFDRDTTWVGHRIWHMRRIAGPRDTWVGEAYWPLIVGLGPWGGPDEEAMHTRKRAVRLIVFGNYYAVPEAAAGERIGKLVFESDDGVTEEYDILHMGGLRGTGPFAETCTIVDQSFSEAMIGRTFLAKLYFSLPCAIIRGSQLEYVEL